jgi:hypothetical protein
MRHLRVFSNIQDCVTPEMFQSLWQLCGEIEGLSIIHYYYFVHLCHSIYTCNTPLDFTLNKLHNRMSY